MLSYAYTLTGYLFFLGIGLGMRTKLSRVNFYYNYKMNFLLKHIFYFICSYAIRPIQHFRQENRILKG